MDVDPKPTTEPTLSPAQPATSVPIGDISPVTNSVTPASNPLVSSALAQELSKDKQPQVGSSPLVTGKPKKSRRTLIIVAVIILILIIAGLAWYVFWGMPKATTVSKAPASTAQPTVAPATAATNAATIDDAASSMESSASDEATTSSTDDSAAATDASATAGNVGGSVDENSF